MASAERSRRRPAGALAYLTGLAKLYIPANLPICLACGRDYPWLCVAQAALGVYLGTITVNGNAPKPSSYDRAAEQRALAKLVRRREAALRRRLRKIEADLERVEDVDGLRARGSALLAALSTLPRDARTATVMDWSAEPPRFCTWPQTLVQEPWFWNW